MKALWLLAAALPALAQEPLRLTLKRAVEIAIGPQGSTRVQLAGEAVKQAEARAAQARAALLPDLSGTVSEQSQTRNLAAFGLRFTLPFPGLQFPTFVGPFNVFDARANITQSIFDLSSIRRFQAARLGSQAARTERTAAEDQAAAAVARAYMAALRTDADVEAARANVELANALVRLAENQKQAGTGTGIEITRARVQLANERQRLVLAENERSRALLALKRAMGMRLDTNLELADRLELVVLNAVQVEAARAHALRLRADMQAQRERESAARKAADAARWERLPAVAGFGDYGSIGTSIDHALPTRTYGVAVRIPLFDGGRKEARRAEAQSQYRQEQIRTHDLQDQSEMELRLAIDGLRSAEEQVKAAEEGLGLAQNEVEQARRRYEAGVAGSLEVTDAQTRLARARDNRTTALFLHSQARIDFAQATGTIRGLIQ